MYKHTKAILPDIILMENVEEIQQWGPLDADGHPIKERRGEDYQKFITAMKSLGYVFDCRELVAADYGAPTTRKHWYAIFRRDGREIVWPAPTHFKDREPHWKACGDYIDWSDLGRSIFDRPKPLADATMKRIANGIRKYIIENPAPYIVKDGGKLFVSYLDKAYGGNYAGCGSDLSNPCSTITTVDHGTLKSTGKDSASKYAEGMESQSERAKTAGRTINDSADSGARSKTGYDAGYGFGSGFVSGIQAWVGQGVVAAANLAAQALESAKTTIDSHSPSKETMKLGKYFGQGFELGIAGEKKRVGNASKELANVALQSLDMSSVTDRMRETMALNAARVTRSFGIETNSMILNKHQAEMMLHLSDTEINRLAKAVGKYTAAVVQKQKPAPIYLGTERIDKSLPKGAIPRI